MPSCSFDIDVIWSGDTARACKAIWSSALAGHIRQPFVVDNSVCSSPPLPVTFKDDTTIASFNHLLSDMPTLLSWFFHTAIFTESVLSARRTCHAGAVALPLVGAYVHHLVRILISRQCLKSLIISIVLLKRQNRNNILTKGLHLHVDHNSGNINQMRHLLVVWQLL